MRWKPVCVAAVGASQTKLDVDVDILDSVRIYLENKFYFLLSFQSFLYCRQHVTLCVMANFPLLHGT